MDFVIEYERLGGNVMLVDNVNSAVKAGSGGDRQTGGERDIQRGRHRDRERHTDTETYRQNRQRRCMC